MANLHPEPYPLPEFEFDPDFTKWNDMPHEVEMNRLLEASSALPPGEYLGRVLRWQRADGYAYYLVTSLDPLEIQWIPFLDRWQIEPALIRGLDLNDVAEKVEGQLAMDRLFGPLGRSHA